MKSNYELKDLKLNTKTSFNFGENETKVIMDVLESWFADCALDESYGKFSIWADCKSSIGEVLISEEIFSFCLSGGDIAPKSYRDWEDVSFSVLAENIYEYTLTGTRPGLERAALYMIYENQSAARIYADSGSIAVIFCGTVLPESRDFLLETLAITVMTMSLMSPEDEILSNSAQDVIMEIASFGVDIDAAAEVVKRAFMGGSFPVREWGANTRRPFYFFAKLD